MWEYSITFNQDNLDAFKFAQKKLIPISQELGGVLTTYSSGEFLTILIATPKEEKIRMQYAISNILTTIISTFFKEKFLSKYLHISFGDDINLYALLKALVNFDKETDMHIIKKYLSLENDIFLESFFDFKLSTLKAKWLELSKLANENKNYLLCEDVCIELLKFLIENLEVCCDQVNIICEQNEFKLLDSCFNTIDFENLNSEKSEKSLLCNVISLCPKNINLYYDENQQLSKSLQLIVKIFDNRVKFISPDKICKNT